MDLRETYPDMCLLGLTATPIYHDEKKQGWLKKLFPQGIIAQVTAEKLMAEKILAQPILEEPITHFIPEFDEGEYKKWIRTYKDLPEEIVTQLAKSQNRNDTIVSTYLKNKERYGKTIIFADRWFQCEYLSEALNKRGVRVDAIYSHNDTDPNRDKAKERPKDKNAKVLDAFRRNDLDVLINVRMLTEGTDVPDVQTVFLTRQTTSRILLTQMVGRALRGPKFGGTDKAYIVAFVDDWKQAINWAGYDQLTDGWADSSVPEPPPPPPLHVISIELVRQLARQMDSGLNIASRPFLTFIPIGWYQVEFETLIKGSDNLETVKRLVLVFQNERQAYQNLIDHLINTDIEEFSSESIDMEPYQGRLIDWQRQFFSQNSDHIGGDFLLNLFHIARHIAQNAEKPLFL